MKKLMTSIMALLLLCTGSAQAGYQQDCCIPSDPCCSNDSWYVGGFAGANWLTGNRHQGCFSGKTRYQTGYALAVSVGRTIGCDFRAEFEYIYRNNEFKGNTDCDFCAPRGDVWSNAYMLNGFYNISLCNDWCLQPFVGLGIGYATHRIDLKRNAFICENSNKKNGFAWQVIAGVEYPFCDNIAIALEYRFFQSQLKNLYSQTLGAGLRYSF